MYCNTVGVKTPTALKYILHIAIYLICLLDAYFVKIYFKKSVVWMLNFINLGLLRNKPYLTKKSIRQINDEL